MTLQVKSFDSPDESREFHHGAMQVLDLQGVTVGKAVFQPGWQWSKDVKDLVGTPSCQERHELFVLSGCMHVRMDDGSEGEASAGQVAVISPGHDAWVVGDEAVTVVDWASASTYARSRAESGVPGQGSR